MDSQIRNDMESVGTHDGDGKVVSRDRASVTGIKAPELEFKNAIVELSNELLEVSRLELLLAVNAKEVGEQASGVHFMRVQGCRALCQRCLSSVTCC